MKKRVCILYILLLVLLLSTNVSWGFDKSNIPSIVKIGLNYGGNSASIVNLYSPSGFEFGYHDDKRFYTLFGLMNVENIVIRKDEYYKIQIGKTFSSKDEMENLLSSLQNSSYYPVYEDGWKIYTGLFNSKEEAEEFINSNGEINDKKLQSVNPNNKIVMVLNKEGKVLFAYDGSKQEYNFRPFLDKDGNDIISVNGKRYRGEIIIRRFLNSDMTVINYLGLNEYLYGIKEVPGDWPLEALKAQAVAARNFAIANMNKHKDYGFDLCDTTDCQVYGGYDSEQERNNRAVDETTGKILTYDGKIVSAYFHSNSGGHTEDSENVWSTYIPYIRGVDDEFSLGAPNSTWTKVYSINDIKTVLEAQGMKFDDITSLNAEKYTANGSVLALKIRDGSNEVTLEKNDIRKVFGYNDIKSLRFNISTDIDYYIKSVDMNNIVKKPLNRVPILSANGAYKPVANKTYKIFDGEDYVTFSGDPTKYILNGKGWGHGLGMSQWGAKKMAELGYTYEEILKHYYTGTTIE